jgi:hypothetical protein
MPARFAVVDRTVRPSVPAPAPHGATQDGRAEPQPAKAPKGCKQVCCTFRWRGCALLMAYLLYATALGASRGRGEWLSRHSLAPRPPARYFPSQRSGRRALGLLATISSQALSRHEAEAILRTTGGPLTQRSNGLGRRQRGGAHQVVAFLAFPPAQRLLYERHDALSISAPPVGVWVFTALRGP